MVNFMSNNSRSLPKNEKVFLYTLFSIGIISVGVVLGSISVQKETRLSSFAAGCNLGSSYLKSNITNSSCLDCLNKAAGLDAAYKRDNPLALSSCTLSERVNYWCNGGWDDLTRKNVRQGSDDCKEKMTTASVCKSSCNSSSVSPGNSPTPTKNISPSPTSTQNRPTDTESRPTATPIPTRSTNPNPSPTPRTGNPTQTLSKCEFLEGDQNAQDSKLDWIFLADGYADQNDFRTEVMDNIKALKETNLGTERLNKINFWIAPEVTVQDYKVNSSGWDRKAASEQSRACQSNAYTIITTNEDAAFGGGWLGLGYLGEGSSIVLHTNLSDKYNEKYKLSHYIAAHEAGHMIANLGDAYPFSKDGKPINSGNGDVPPINCSIERASKEDKPCPRWEKYNDPTVECIQICGFDNWFKSSDSSIMGGWSHDFDRPSREGWDFALRDFN